MTAIGWFANQEIHDLAIDNAELRSGPRTTSRTSATSLAAKQDPRPASDNKQIAEAIKHLDKSLDADCGSTTPTDPSKGQEVFEEEKKAVKDLLKVKDMVVADEISTSSTSTATSRRRQSMRSPVRR